MTLFYKNDTDSSNRRSWGTSLAVALTMGFSALTTQALADSSLEVKAKADNAKATEKSIEAATGQSQSSFASSFVFDQELERYIVMGTHASLAQYRGGVDGLEATSTEGKSKLDVTTSASQAYLDFLGQSQEEMLANIEARLGRNVEALLSYKSASNGVLIELTAIEAEKLAGVTGVAAIQKDELRTLARSDSDYSAYALPMENNSSMVWVYAAGGIGLFTVLGFVWMVRTNRLNSRNSVLASLFATMGLAGCFYEGGFAWIGAPDIWWGVGPYEGTKGEGVVVGVIDTGINPISDSFAAEGGDGYVHTNPKGQYFGVCDPSSDVYDETFPCNDKLIGAWGYFLIDDGSARDMDGHGSHTAGTSAGNIVHDATVTAPTGFQVSKTIAGVAPHANVISYKVCGEPGCYLGAILGAVDQAILDGVDVINYSIGGGSSNPWADLDAMNFLAAMDAGIFVATSGGNSGPEFATLGSPADAPWITSVAASSHNLNYENWVADMTGGDTTPPADILGLSVSPGYGPAKIVDAADYGNAQCLEGEFNARFDGEIVICDAGQIARVAKGQNVLANGGGALILTRPPRSPDGSGYLETDTHYLPASHITYTDAQKIRDWMASGEGHMATLTGTEMVQNNETADTTAYFSSRGMNPSVPSIVKPNITAPGRAIFAAYHEGYGDAEQDYNIIQGTSMSSPHIAGAGALLVALHPEWTPMQVQSAMMTTAMIKHNQEDDTQADPFDVGAGRIDLPKAALAGLLMDETTAGFLAANPANGGEPADLNLSSLGQSNCVVTCTWTRTMTNVLDVETKWKAKWHKDVTVSPKKFNLAPGESVEVTFTLDVSDKPLGEWYFTNVKFRELGKKAPKVHLPVAALPSLSNLPGAVEITAAQDVDSVSITGVQAVEITDGTVNQYGLALATITENALVSDPTNGSAFDGFDPAVDGTFYFNVEVPEGASQLVVTTSGGSGDVDLFLSHDRKPNWFKYNCSSRTWSNDEECVINTPKAGTWYIGLWTLWGYDDVTLTWSYE